MRKRLRLLIASVILAALAFIVVKKGLEQLEYRRELISLRKLEQASAFALPETLDSVPGAGPIQPGLWFRRHWMMQRERWNSRTVDNRTRLVFLGDSITESWGENMRGYFPEFGCFNQGIAGDTSRGILLRLDDVDRRSPQMVVLAIGINDLALGASPSTIACNVERTVDALTKKNSTRILICEVLPCSREHGVDPELVSELNKKLMEFCEKTDGAYLVPAWAAFTDDRGSLIKEDFDDGLHLSRAGYKKLSHLYEESIEMVLASLAVAQTGNAS